MGTGRINCIYKVEAGRASGTCAARVAVVGDADAAAAPPPKLYNSCASKVV